MSTRATVIASVVMIALAILLSLSFYSRLPEAMASHWGFNDQVNGTMPRFWGAFLMPIVTFAMLGLFLLLPAIDPLKANIAKFRQVFNAFILVIIAFMLYIHVLTLAWNLGDRAFRMSTAIVPAIGLLFVVAGVLISKAKRNFFIGIRTPWTLASDHVWDVTHRVGAVAFIVCGIVALAGIFFPGPVAFLLVIAPILVCTLFLVVYSYVLWAQEQSKT